MMLHVARRVLPCVRCAKNACKPRTFLSRMHSDKASGRDVDDRTIAGVGATPPFGAQRQPKDHNVVPATASIGQEVLLQLMKLKDDLLAAGKEHYVQARKYLIKAVEELDDVFEPEAEKKENEWISEAFKEAGIDVTISYMFWREKDASRVNRNSSIHIDREGNISGTVSRPAFPAMKELTFYPYPNLQLMAVNVYISNHYILMLEKEEAEKFHIEIRHLAIDGVRQPNSTILNPNAWFIKERKPGQETFAIGSVVVPGACIQAGTEVALKAVKLSMCDKNLQSITIPWQP